MAIVTRWDNKKKSVILLEFESEWSWDELEEAVQKADRLIGSVEHRVDLIIDLGRHDDPARYLYRRQDLAGIRRGAS